MSSNKCMHAAAEASLTPERIRAADSLGHRPAIESPQPSRLTILVCIATGRRLYMSCPSQASVYLRFARYLLWEFRWSLGVFWGLVLVGGVLIRLFYHDAGPSGEPLSLVEACYAVFLLIFLESYLDFPREWYLQPLFFLLPIIGLGAVADSLVRMAYLVFARKRKLPEFQRMVASLYRNHILVVGVGKVGYRVIRELLAIRESVVAIDRLEESPLLDEVLELGVPVIHGDGRQKKVLEQAGCRHAKAVVITTQDDLANLDAALTARDLNPEVRLALRMFDESLAAKVDGAFAMPAISIDQVAAPAFIAAATGRKVYQLFELAGQPVHLTDVSILPGGALAERSVGEVQTQWQVNIVMHHGSGGVIVNPSHEEVIHAGDTLLVMAPGEKLVAFEKANKEPLATAPER